MKYNRLYYTIGQVSKISGLPQSVLRYWETVIAALNPPKSEGGTRQYRESDVELILEIKRLLYDEGFTIKGANKYINKLLVERQDSSDPEDGPQGVESQKAENGYSEMALEPGINSGYSNADLTTYDYIIRELKKVLRQLDE
jgi:DNA-binding transcriptional MerR regulator